MVPTAESATLHVGPYTVRQQPMFDNPAWAHYLIFRSGKLIGKQLSYPTLDDCRWHENRRGQYALEGESSRLPHGYTAQTRWWQKRGRPTNAERERRARELLTVEE